MKYLETTSYNEDVIAIFDRNIITRVIELAKGKVIPNNESIIYKIAAGVMAFLISTQCLIETNISLYEYNSKNTFKDTKSELKYFRIADNINPNLYMEIVKCKKKIIDKKYILEAKGKIKYKEKLEIDFKMKINIWKIKYVSVIKAALIYRDEKIKNEDKIITFLNWMYDDALFDFISFSFSLFLFSNKRPKNIIKKIKTNNKNELINNIRNAAWDLSYLQYLKKKSYENDRCHYIFVTKDNTLRDICELLYSVNFITDTNIEPLIQKLFVGKLAKTIILAYNNIQEKIKINIKKEHKIAYCKNIDLIIKNYEKELKGIAI